MIKTILITGSTDGIGKLAALQLAKENHEVYIHGRNPSKLAKVIAEVKEHSSNDHIKGFVADFSDLNDVKRMSVEITNKVPKIDVLINNAGVFKSASNTNAEGHDIRVAVNYFAPYLLTNSLIPLLKKGSSSRIINVSSAAQSSITEEVLRGQEIATLMESYSQSKLAITMWSMHMAKTLKDVTVIPVNPGSLLDTNMVREAFGKSRSSANKGGDILVQLANSEDLVGFSGTYYDNDKGAFGKAHQDAYDEEKIEQLNQLTIDILGH